MSAQSVQRLWQIDRRPKKRSDGQVGQLGQVDRVVRGAPMFQRASEINATAIDWIWPSMVPVGALSVLESLPGHGKSTLVCDLAAAVSIGREFPLRNGNTVPAGVVLLNGEDDANHTLIPRLQAAGADLERINLMVDSLILPTDLPYLETAVTTVGARLVVIDPITSFFGPSLNHDQSARRVLTPLKEMAKRLHIAIILVRHLRKAGGRAEYQGAGSIGIAGAARSVLRVDDDPQDRPFTHMVVQSKANLSRGTSVGFRTAKDDDGVLKIEWFTLRMEVRPIKKQSRLREAEAFLYRVLGNGPLLSNEVFRLASENSHARKTISVAKRAIGVRSWKQGDGKTTRTYWELPSLVMEPFSEIALILGDLLRASVVGRTALHPHVDVDRNQVTVVRIHLDGQPLLRITVDSDGQNIKIRAEDGREAVAFDGENPRLFEEFRTAMTRFGLFWTDENYNRLT